MTEQRPCSPSSNIRPSAVAGAFYPQDRRRLEADISAFLEAAGDPVYHAAKALIVPHAGYAYSGRVAAAGFAALRRRSQAIARVILIGPAHYVAVNGIAVPSADAFATPLGLVAVDREAVTSLADLAAVRANDVAHAPEHALEVELPFLQRVLPAFKLVPLLVGNADPLDVAAVLNRLWGGPESLIIVSSDLSHYLDYSTAQRRDLLTAQAIEAGDWRRLRPNDACGFLAIAGLLAAANPRGIHGSRLALCNSGDSAGSRDRVVGYGAWVFTATELG